MAKKTTLAAGTSPFAHLLGGAAALAGRALGRRAEDEDKPEGEEGDNEPDAEEEDTGEPDKGKRGNKAESEDDDADPDAEDESDDPDAEDEDADEPEGKKAETPYKRGYAAANKRARAIFAAPEAAGRPDLAAQLAFETRLTAAEAIGVLATTGATAPTGRGRTLDDRMGNRNDPRPGAGGGTTGEASFADKMASALKKAGR